MKLSNLLQQAVAKSDNKTHNKNSDSVQASSQLTENTFISMFKAQYNISEESNYASTKLQQRPEEFINQDDEDKSEEYIAQIRTVNEILEGQDFDINFQRLRNQAEYQNLKLILPDDFFKSY